jgi:hypothetical protein
VIAAAVGLLLMQAVVQGGAPAPGSVQRGIEVRPDTVTVGDPFEVIVRVRAPLGSSIEFPQTPDSGAAVEAVDPVQVTQANDSTAVEQTAVYRVAAWDIGQLAIPFGDAIVRDGARTLRVGIRGVTVFVASVLPPDTAQRLPKPPRDIFTFGPPWWVWALAALAAALLLWLLYWLWKRRGRAAQRVEDPYEAAEREFERVASLGLIAAGERTRHLSLMVEILREYLGHVAPGASAALTTSELLAELRGTRLPTARLAALLNESDLVKFARRPVTAQRAELLGGEARAIAATIHEATTAPPEEKAA